MANWPFSRGVHDIGNGIYAYVQPDGTWGWSNAGLIASQGHTLLVDTLMSVPLTRDMLRELRSRVPAAAKIDRVLNTHANPDHFFGNGLVADAEIIATRETAREMASFDPKLLSGLAANHAQMGEAGEFLFETMGRQFDFSGVETLTLPSRTFERRLSLQVGDTPVELIDLGPAHTSSDTIAWLPRQRVVFTGDLLFNEGHPIVWAGPVDNWIDACRHILDLDPEVVVPGHGPITDSGAVKRLAAYFDHLRAEARKRFDAGIDYEAAARDIPLGAYTQWSDPERIVANVFALYRQWGAAFTAEQSRDLFGAMGRFHKARARERAL